MASLSRFLLFAESWFYIAMFLKDLKFFFPAVKHSLRSRDNRSVYFMTPPGLQTPLFRLFTRSLDTSWLWKLTDAGIYCTGGDKQVEMHHGWCSIHGVGIKGLFSSPPSQMACSDCMWGLLVQTQIFTYLYM